MSKSKQSRQDDSITVEWLANAIGQATRSAKFCVAGGLPVVDPDIEVDGLGAIRLPLKQTAAKKLVACCQTAPYGKGTQTLVDTRVRKTFELDPKSFRLGDAWNSAIADAARTVAEQLGLPADRLEARLYKLLVYEKGGDSDTQGFRHPGIQTPMNSSVGPTGRRTRSWNPEAV